MKVAFTGPGRFYSFNYPDAPDDISTGDFVYDPIGDFSVSSTVYLGFTWDPNNDSTEFLWSITLTFTSEFEGTYESTYTDNTVAPPIAEDATGTFRMIDQ